MSKEFKIERDKFSERRGGKSTIYEISCASCETSIMHYQKDGKGSLIRCYVDRILDIQNIKPINNNTESTPIEDYKSLICGGCDSLIGTSMVYKPENRLAFYMHKGTFSRKPYKVKK